MRVRAFLFLNRLLYGVSIVLFSVVLLNFILMLLFGRDGKFVIYPLSFDDGYEKLFGITIQSFLYIGIALALISIFSPFVAGKDFQNRLAARAVFLIFFANILMCFALFKFGFLEQYATLTTLSTTNHIYRLAVYRYDEPYNTRYFVYKCDLSGLFCWQLQEFSDTLDTNPMAAVEQTELVLNPVDNTLELYVNGEVTWTHAP